MDFCNQLRFVTAALHNHFIALTDHVEDFISGRSDLSLRSDEIHGYRAEEDEGADSGALRVFGGCSVKCQCWY